MSNPAYLQNFGKLRKDMRKREVHDTMSASGRWDDLYLRASKPYIPQVGRRQSMRANCTLTIKSKNGNDPVVWTGKIPGAATVALGFVSDPTKHKYRLDSPSYPSRARELSHQPKPLQKYLLKDGRIEPFNVHNRIAWLIRKIRFAQAGQDGFRRELAVVFQNRHALANLFHPMLKPEVKPEPVKVVKPKVVKVTKPKPRKVAKSVYEEYEKIKSILRLIDQGSQLAHESWDKVAKADRQELLRRQRVLLSIIQAGK
jgi:hypothetical protein